MHGADGQQRRDVAGAGDSPTVDAVAEHDDLARRRATAAAALAADPLDGVAQAPRPARDLGRRWRPGPWPRPKSCRAAISASFTIGDGQLELAGVLRGPP